MGRVLAALGLALVLALLVIACGDSGGSVETPPSVATETPSTPAAPVETPTSGPADGATLYADNCSGCHGADGSGGQGPDIRDKTKVSDIADQVEHGGGGMPSFDGQLTPEEIQTVAEHVATKL